MHDAADAARVEPAFSEDRANASDDTLLRVRMRRQYLAAPAAAAVVIMDDEMRSVNVPPISMPREYSLICLVLWES